jgi:hypothetical protein
VTHRPIADGEPVPVVAHGDRVEFVGGPRDGHSEERHDMPEILSAGGGDYRRSVRCAEDGSMRYVWITPEPNGRT